jgi:hypothetical protein
MVDDTVVDPPRDAIPATPRARPDEEPPGVVGVPESVATAARASSDVRPSRRTKTTPAPRRGRRVKRVVRRIDLWSVLKLALVVYTCAYVATLVTLAGAWGLLYSSGQIDKLESFLGDVGLDNFTFYGSQMFQASAAIGAVAVIAATVITVLATALVNLISEMTGGIRVVVIEEDVEA